MQHANFTGPYPNESVWNGGQNTAMAGELKLLRGTIFNSLLKDWASILAPTKISCSAVLKAVAPAQLRSPLDLRSHTFLNVDIEDIYLSKRSNTYSILVGTLLAVLRDRVHTERGLPRDLANVIHGAGAAQEPIIIATSRVPCFGSDIENPMYGYRSLGLFLASVRVAKDIPLAAGIQLDQELLAIDAPNNPIAQTFAQTWAPYGAKAETHFIIIFNDLSGVSPIHSRHGSPFSNHALRSTSTPGSRHSSVGFQTSNSPSPIAALTSLHGLGDASSDGSRMGSPAIVMAVNRQLSESPLTGQFPSTPILQGVAGAHLVPGTSVETVCRSHGITDEALQAARYKSAEKTFLGKVLNHRHMLEVLVKLGLQERFGTIFMASRSVTFAGCLQLAAVNVVTEFGWSVDSYKHKTVWFGWAEEVSSRRWARAIPGEYFSVSSRVTWSYSEQICYQ